MILTDEMKRYYERHILCPKCGRKAVETSMSPPIPIEGIQFSDVLNRVACGECGWSGVVNQLKG